jgi:hypothetical protein
MRLPLNLTQDDCAAIGAAVREAIHDAHAHASA